MWVDDMEVVARIRDDESIFESARDRDGVSGEGDMLGWS